MSVVRPEFGPTLPELLAPRVRALPRAAQVALAVLAALVVAGAVYVVVRRRESDQRPQAVVRSPIAYNLLYASPLERVAPRGRETLRLQTPAGAAAPQRFTVTPCSSRPTRATRRGMLHAAVGEHDRADAARAIPGLRVARRRQGATSTTAGLRDPLPGEDRRPRDLRPPTILLPGGDTPPREGVDIWMRRRAARPRPRASTPSARDGGAQDRRSAPSASAPSARERGRAGHLRRLRSPSTSASGGSSRSRTSRRRDGRRGSCASTSARRSAIKRSSAQITNYAREDLEGRLVARAS